ncbi:ATP-binding cassette domain-containing protein [Leadbettera azotonutricia]|uniref:Xylose import ATP-binding protein XylG n=1 Tax=Leadbettera azotonutricia (strain ATCC BAA-888 / DSM 13862 / ZAS-9) TaxID=545695 RepID=F5YBE2_LEAAZ|nr:ATP-binding cassette domain-containing protein [Leadbettera azotonutricia]AEF80488.1 xylose import ATP-binding protein XylG [Leadbettera azotonutricia ZAS-9]
MDEYILQVENLTKEFPGVRALDQVNFRVKKGEIHSLCGENGAGKSTLMSVISGVYPKGSYEGTVLYKGHETNYHSVKDSEKEGLAIIHQELALSPYLSIYENIFLGHMKTRLGIINWDYYIKESQKYLDRVGLKESPYTTVSKLGVGKQQLVEIARALSKEVDLLILDEPTSSLNDEESNHLLDLILEFKRQGITAIMISHKLNEVLRIADSITIFRDGKTISTYDVKADNLTEAVIIKDMVGRDLTHRFPDRKSNPGETIMEVKNWSVYHPDYHSMKVVDNASFNLRKGEILAFCGPMGAGRTELMMSIYGKSYGSRSEGELWLHGKKIETRSAKAALEAGIGYVSEDRKNLGLILIQTIKNNISASSLAKKFSRFGLVLAAKEISEAEKYRNELRIKTPSINQLARNLSGGNQQKVVVGRILMADPDIFIVDEPTRGIDVGAKTEIYEIINELAAQGKSVIMVSSELPEALGMADRIYVMNEGEIKGVLNHDEATQEKIMHMALVG